MAVRWETVGGKAVIDGRTLADWVPDVVRTVVERFDPVRVILFGSVARGEDGPDSDIDILVVFDSIDYDERGELMARIRGALTGRVAVDVYVTDERECRRRRDVVGSMHYWPLREGRVVHERAA